MATATRSKKRCSMCKRRLPLDQFHRDRSRPDGLNHRCKSCNKAHSTKYYRKRSREYHRAYELKYYYGMTTGDYESLQQKQGGMCAICRQNPEGRLAVDHDHDTGKIRGLLCRTCNSAIGLLRHDSVLLLAAVAYLSEQA